MKAQLEAAFGRISQRVPGSRVASYASTGDSDFVSHDGRTTFGLVYPNTGLDATSIAKAQREIKAALAGVTVAG